LPGVAKGLVPVRVKIQWGETSRWANVGFGQGIGVTPLQLLVAMATIANGGVRVTPHFLQGILDHNGRMIQEHEVTGTRVLKEVTAAQMVEILRSVVVNGSGSRAEIPGYRVAGKTGTAQVAEGGRYTERRISSFVGFAPADDPRIAAVVVLYDPKGETYGGVIAAPVFKEIVEDALERMGVPRRQEPGPKSQANVFQSEHVRVPNVLNFPKGDAETLLRQAGLRYQFNGEGEIVFDQVPAPGTTVPWGTVVQLLAYNEVAYDASDERVTVPSVLGLSMREVAARLANAGLRLQVHGSGLAVRQDPAPGTEVPRDYIVNVFFASPSAN